MRERLFDEKDRAAIGWIKRVLEYCTMIPGFNEEFDKAPQETLDKYGFPLTPEDVTFLPADPKEPRHMEAKYPDSKAAVYADFVNRKIASVDSIRDACKPDEPRFAKWRDLQMDRCVLDLGPQYQGIIHTPLTFELAKGCSVGCEFCGLNAGPLRGIFRYTEENAALWKDVLDRAKDLLGNAVGEAPLYFGTEPLDNPDYELFKDDFRSRFGNLPQITTAVSTRNIERLRPLIRELNEEARFIYRFSILSREMFEEIMRAFTPEELVLVELLPQFSEAPGNHFAAVGRNADNKSEDKEEASGTISCVSGFIINMFAKTVTLSTPTWVDADHPEGQYILARDEFTDASDLFDKINRMIKENMKVYLEPDDILCDQPYLDIVRKDGKLRIESVHGTALEVKGKDGEDLLEKLFELTKQRCYTRREIVTKFVEDSEFPAAASQYLFHFINKFWAKGVFTVKGGLHG